MNRRRGLVCWTFSWTFALAVSTSHSLHAGPPPQSVQQHPSLLSIPAKSWAVDAVAKEIEIINHSGSYIRYHQRAIDDKGDELRDIVESKDGSVARLIKRDNRPLTPDEDQAERERLTSLLNHPAEYARHIKNDAGSKKIAIDMINLMPSAMIYTYAPDQSPRSGSAAPQVVIDYAPDPGFNPPNTTSVALTGLRGRVWIDAESKTIVHMTGDVFRPINVGWGMIARIYPGGKIDFDQAQVTGSRWNMINFHENLTARALMLKSIAIKKEVHALDFQSLPGPMSYQDGIHLLLDTYLPK